MDVSLTRVYEVACGHHLPNLPEHHKCRRPHGHNYQIHVTLTGEPDHYGMLVESGALDAMIMPVLLRIDHHDINELGATLTTRAGKAYVDNPTVEHMAIWLYESLGFLFSANPVQKFKHRIRVFETRRLYAEVGS